MPPVKRKPKSKPKKSVVQEVENQVSLRALAIDHAGEIFAGLTGLGVVICATVATALGVLDSNALSIILGGAAGAGGGFAAGKTNKK